MLMTSGQGMGPMPGDVARAAAEAAPAGITPTPADQITDASITVITVDPGPVARCRPLCYSWNVHATRRNRCVIIIRKTAVTAVTGAGVVGSALTCGRAMTGTHEAAVLPARPCSA